MYWLYRIILPIFDISSVLRIVAREMFDVCLLGCGARCEGADIFASPISFHFAGGKIDNIFFDWGSTAVILS